LAGRQLACARLDGRARGAGGGAGGREARRSRRRRARPDPVHHPPGDPRRAAAALPGRPGGEGLMAAFLSRLSTKQKVLLGLAIYFGITILLLAVAGSQGKNEEFKPQNEFKLDNWIPIHIGGIDLSITKAVLYLLLASGLTIFAMVYIARRMQ